MSLSDKRKRYCDMDLYSEEDVKKFIRELSKVYDIVDDLLIDALEESSLLRQTISRILIDNLINKAGKRLCE